MKQLCESEKCTGCFACINVCPREAITETIDSFGKTIPRIDEGKCVDCGLCTKSCPALNDSKFYETVQCFAAWTKNEVDQKTCASGGIATVLYRTVINNGGVVFGCAYTENFELKFIEATNEDELDAFKGSKYVQANISDSYRKAKRYLKDGRTVLFVGTPCQIDGLLHFLGKEYDNLYTVDIICHGVTPFKNLEDYLDYLKIDKKNTKVYFRGKDDFTFLVEKHGKKVYRKESYRDYYYESFLKGITYRENCYNCRYAQKQRVADITIGDFWGIDRAKYSIDYLGKLSVVLVNTEKGNRLMDLANARINVVKADFEDAYANNKQLNEPSKVTVERVQYEQNIEKGFVTAIKETYTGKYISETYSNWKNMKRKTINHIKRFVHKKKR